MSGEKHLVRSYARSAYEKLDERVEGDMKTGQRWVDAVETFLDLPIEVAERLVAEGKKLPASVRHREGERSRKGDSDTRWDPPG